MLAPHHREDTELGFRGFALQDRADFIELEPREIAHAWGAASDGTASAALRPFELKLCTIDSRITRPSTEPSSASAARSGCGIIPITLRLALQMPAISSMDPFGLSTYLSTTRSSALSAASSGPSA